MSSQQTSRAPATAGDDTDEELTPAGMFAFLLFGLPLILLLLCEVFDLPGLLIP